MKRMWKGQLAFEYLLWINAKKVYIEWFSIITKMEDVLVFLAYYVYLTKLYFHILLSFYFNFLPEGIDQNQGILHGPLIHPN